MKKITLLVCLIIFSCSGQLEHRNAKPDQVASIESKIVNIDYRYNDYHISLGQHIDESGKHINWRWEGMNDKDGIPDSGSDANLSFAEPKIHYNSQEFVMALHVQTNSHLITRFQCSVYFELENSNSAVATFLDIIKKDFQKIRIDSVRKSIMNNGFYGEKNDDYSEFYKLSNNGAFDTFEYLIEYID